MVFDDEIKLKYLIELVKNGVYKFSIMSEAIKKKLMIDKELNEKAFVINQEQANKIRSELK